MSILTSILASAPQLLSKKGIVDGVPTVQLGAAEDSTYFVAKILMECSRWICGLFGQSANGTLFTWVYAILVFVVSLIIGHLFKLLIVYITRKAGDYINAHMNGLLIKHKVYLKLTRIVPALVFLILIQFTLVSRVTLATWLTRLTWIYVVYAVTAAMSSMALAIWDNFNARRNVKHLPLRGLVQLIQGILWIVAVIVAFAILFDKSPGSLLAGLGAFSAVLMLVFKDNILGVVAGVQLSENDALHVGDWISIPGSDANGTVQEVSLVAVKILNWDMTTSTVPPYSLISKGFKNYRSMQQSNTRRIQRSYMIDADSVVPTTDEMLKEFAAIPLMKTWIETKIAQKAAGKEQNVSNPDGLVDGTIDTNLGLFRAYAKLWLDANPHISHDSTCFITTLAQTPYGIPFQVYCFSATSAWLPYESIQADVFEHLAVMMYRFKLYTYESASGRDTIIDGYLSAGKSTDYLFGIPYPYYNHSGAPGHPGMPPSGLYPPLNPMATSASVSSAAPTPTPTPASASTPAPNSNTPA